jgi:hypothetical protein
MSILAIALSSCASNQSKKSDPGSEKTDPKLLKPVVRKIWIAPEIRNNGTEWVEGHYMFRIEKETVWSR